MTLKLYGGFLLLGLLSLSVVTFGDEPLTATGISLTKLFETNSNTYFQSNGATDQESAMKICIENSARLLPIQTPQKLTGIYKKLLGLSNFPKESFWTSGIIYSNATVQDLKIWSSTNEVFEYSFEDYFENHLANNGGSGRMKYHPKIARNRRDVSKSTDCDCDCSSTTPIPLPTPPICKKPECKIDYVIGKICKSATSNCKIDEEPKCTIEDRTCTVECAPCVVVKQPVCTVVESSQPRCRIENVTKCDNIPPNCNISSPVECKAVQDNCTYDEADTCQYIKKPCKNPCTVRDCSTTQPPCITTTTCKPETTTRKSCEKECRKKRGTEVIVEKECEKACATPPSDTGCETVTICPPPSSSCTRPFVDCSPEICQSPIYICLPPKIHCPPVRFICEPKIDCQPQCYEEPEVICKDPETKCTKPKVHCPSGVVHCPPLISKCDPVHYNCEKPNTEGCKSPIVTCGDPIPCSATNPVNGSDFSDGGKGPCGCGSGKCSGNLIRRESPDTELVEKTLCISVAFGSKMEADSCNLQRKFICEKEKRKGNFITNFIG